MTLGEFLKLHDGGGACVSIYFHNHKGKTKYFCEEEAQSYILESEWFEEIKDRTVRKFCVLGGGCYPVELYIQIAEN